MPFEKLPTSRDLNDPNLTYNPEEILDTIDATSLWGAGFGALMLGLFTMGRNTKVYKRPGSLIISMAGCGFLAQTIHNSYRLSLTEGFYAQKKMQQRLKQRYMYSLYIKDKEGNVHKMDVKGGKQNLVIPKGNPAEQL
mmetsp:Transcript_11308/g.16747  ORF Transcript_11308/g.16747 Transcript_11308/m.16747 type:complete len:138 (+) Transcript_11308:43-456(+)